jgi:hypothetical protein
MKSDSNDELQPSRQSAKKRFSSSRNQNLEFSFEDNSTETAESETTNPTISPDTFTSRAIPRTTNMSTLFEESKPKSKQPTPSVERTTESSSSNGGFKSASKTPTAVPFTQYQQNVQRQSREQKAVGSLLSGVAIVLIGSIVLVAGLAGYGGWMLSKQIKQQSVTMAQLESKLNTDIQSLHENILRVDATVESLNTQLQAQKQQITWLQNQLEDARAQAKKSDATILKQLKSMDGRLLEMERIQQNPAWRR